MRWRSAPVRVRPARPAARVLALVHWYRRPLACVLGLLALLLAIDDRAAPPAPTVTVLTAAHDLVAGSVLNLDDLTSTSLPRALVPDGVLRHDERATWAGRVVALPVRRGEVLTDVRVLDLPLLDLLTPADEAPGRERVAVAVRVADPATVTLVRVGDVIDVLAAGESGSARIAAPAARVLSVARTDESTTSLLGASGAASGTAGVLVVAVPPPDALTLARAAAVERLSVAVRRPTPP